MTRSLLAAVFLVVAVDSGARVIRGRVVDSTSAPLPGVSVEAAKHVTVTGKDGGYALDVPAGITKVTFSLSGFATVVKDVDGDARIDITLSPAASAEVVVHEPRDLLGVANAASVGIVPARQIERRSFLRAGEILETIPGVIVSQHSGEGKANQYYLRGFNLDHGTDIAISVAGVPVNMPSHAHGQGYADANFVIPELVGDVRYKKGPYFADEGDFSSAGAVDVDYLTSLDRPIAVLQSGNEGYRRALFADSPRVGDGALLVAVEAGRNDGPWVRPDRLRKLNAVIRYTRGDFNITGMAYDARWSSTDQIPRRAVDEGRISRFGLVDPTDGGSTHRWSLSSEWHRNGADSVTRVTGYAVDYKLDLFSNFTYFLDDPDHGDQFEQADDRIVAGATASHRWLAGRTENVAGVDIRSDDIRNLGLYHTAGRERLSTTRQDDVRETSAAIYAQSAVQWSPKLRSILGLRVDRFRFDVSGTSTDASLFSPKLALIFGPWHNMELYANAGSGFHSNDARSAAGGTPLVRTTGAELGLRTVPHPRLHLTAALWALDIASELVFVGDAGTTAAGRPSRRTGVELDGFWNARDWLTFDADIAWSRARFRNFDVAGDRIPGAVEGVASAGVAFSDLRRFTGMLRVRWFGPRPLISDYSVRSKASRLVNGRIGYSLTPHATLNLDVFNILNARVSDIDYFYTSRLRGEPAAGIDDVHTHPAEPRSLRVSLVTRF